MLADGIAADPLHGADPAGAQLEAFIRANIAFIAAHPEHVRAVQQIAYNHGPVGGQEQDAAIGRLVTLFADGRTGAFRAFGNELMSVALRSAIDAMADRLLRGHDPDRCADELVQIFDRATRR
ncbi:hypothetical protein [Nonomuraea sp. NPDC050691]|uniref:hypothetical protein n=1 Tax=Nonomuraea sp. NPDC050691 TaxID=3155661 RepID=UPI0033C62BA8